MGVPEEGRGGGGRGGVAAVVLNEWLSRPESAGGSVNRRWGTLGWPDVVSVVLLVRLSGMVKMDRGLFIEPSRWR